VTARVIARGAVIAALAGACAGAGSPPPPAPAPGGVATITPADVRQRIFIVADDSMGGRGTPSAGLERMTRYAADEFRRLGLVPGGDSGSYVQRYPLTVHRLVPESSAVWASGAATARWALGADMVLAEGPTPDAEVVGGVTIVGGDPQRGVTVDPGAITDQVVILALGPHADAIGAQLIPLRPALAILVLPDSLWSMAPGQSTVQVANPSAEDLALPIPPILYVAQGRLVPWLERAGGTSEFLSSDGSLTARQLPDTRIRLRVDVRDIEHTTAANVVGVVPGSDPTLRSEYVLFTAHMDHIGTASSAQGCSAVGADTICNGADDDGSGTVAVLELAQAFATATPRPRRSMVLALVSGEERGLWGSSYWAAHPTVPLAQVVANLNSDMVGRSDSLRDSVSVIGREHSNLDDVVIRVAAAHPELHLAPVGDLWPQEGLFSRSDHYSFATRGIPALFFTTGLHPDYHGAGDSPDQIDYDKLARFARFLYFVGTEIANAAERPQWNPESYRKVVQSR